MGLDNQSLATLHNDKPENSEARKYDDYFLRIQLNYPKIYFPLEKK